MNERVGFKGPEKQTVPLVVPCRGWVILTLAHFNVLIEERDKCALKETGTNMEQKWILKKIVLLRKNIDLNTYVNIFNLKKSQLLELPQILRGPSDHVFQGIICLILNFK